MCVDIVNDTNFKLWSFLDKFSSLHWLNLLISMDEYFLKKLNLCLFLQTSYIYLIHVGFYRNGYNWISRCSKIQIHKIFHIQYERYDPCFLRENSVNARKFPQSMNELLLEQVFCGEHKRANQMALRNGTSSFHPKPDTQRRYSYSKLDFNYNNQTI